MSKEMTIIKKVSTPADKKSLLRKQNHLTRPPRLEGSVKEKMMQPIKKVELKK